MTFPKNSGIMSYLLVAAGAGAGVVGAAGAFVGAGFVVSCCFVVSSLWEQPANTPKIPDSTIRVNSLFIVELSFD
jgi:hypothetical protein